MRRAAELGSRHAQIIFLTLLLSLGYASRVAAADGSYRVEDGDTLFSIAREHDIPLEDLLAANQLKADSVIKPGQSLTIPTDDLDDDAPSDAAAPAGPLTYQVQAGDNLYRIAERLHVTVDELTKANSLSAKSILQIGQTLKIPGAQAPAVAPKPAQAAGPPPEKHSLAPVAVPVKPSPTAAEAKPDAGKGAAAAAKAGADEMPAAVWVSETRVHLRRGPSTLEDSLRLVTEGTKLAVTGKSGMWWRVQVPGSEQTAYVAGWVVSEQAIAPPPEASTLSGSAVAYALEPRINIRSGPSTDDERIAVAVRGTKMTVLEEEGGWLKVKFDNGTVGWVAQHLVRRPAPASHGSADGQSLVQTAMAFLGAPYRRGGTSRGGVDCSGLVYAVCRQHGISLPRSSRDMYGHGDPVSRQDLQPGDLVFFKNTYRSGISHVGIYIGNDQFVHAVRPGSGVQITSLSSSYYVNHWAGAYRVTN